MISLWNYCWICNREHWVRQVARIHIPKFIKRRRRKCRGGGQGVSDELSKGTQLGSGVAWWTERAFVVSVLGAAIRLPALSEAKAPQSLPRWHTCTIKGSASSEDPGFIIISFALWVVSLKFSCRLFKRIMGRRTLKGRSYLPWFWLNEFFGFFFSSLNKNKTIYLFIYLFYA